MVQSQETFLPPLAAPSSDPQLSPNPSLKCFLLPTSRATLPPSPLSALTAEFILFCTSQRTEVHTAARRGKGGSQLRGATISRTLPPRRDRFQKQACTDSSLASPLVGTTAHPPRVRMLNTPNGQI